MIWHDHSNYDVAEGPKSVPHLQNRTKNPLIKRAPRKLTPMGAKLLLSSIKLVKDFALKIVTPATIAEPKDAVAS